MGGRGGGCVDWADAERVGTIGLCIAVLLGSDACGAEAGEIGEGFGRWRGWSAARGVAWGGQFEDGFAGAAAEIAIGVHGVAIGESEIVERGERV